MNETEIKLMLRLHGNVHLLVRAKARALAGSYRILLEQSRYKPLVDKPELKARTRICGRTRGWSYVP